MTRQTRNQTGDKVDRPHAHFENPVDVVTDQDLSRTEKARALEQLEQDAKQLSVATGEGMGDGERPHLRAAKVAREALDMPSSDAALLVAAEYLESILPDTVGTRAHSPVRNAIEALNAAREAIESLPHESRHHD